ncbi:MAG: histidine kinase [Sphingosinicella sp.]|nr:histidine kinase [Sphingosinicella sp.]
MRYIDGMSRLTRTFVIPIPPALRARQREKPNVRGKAVLGLTLAFWLSNFMILTLGNFAGGEDKLVALALMRAVLTLFGLALCYVIYSLLQKISHISFKRRVLAIAILSLAAAEIHAWATYFGYSLVDPSRLVGSIRWSLAISNLAFWTWFFLAWAGLCLALEYSFDVKEEERRSSELQALAQTAKLRALHNQVNPHFLFNSLNSISALIIDNRIGEADRMVGRLADFFRMTMAVDPTSDISLKREIELQQVYLDIEQIRFPDLQFKIEIPGPLLNAAVPALLLQPIIENAVKYGVTTSAPPAQIGIKARRDGEQLTISVTDSGCSQNAPLKPGAGIGLRNVRARLEERFGNAQSLSAQRDGASGFEVVIRLPLEML